jgi:hypothetical protein
MNTSVTLRYDTKTEKLQLVDVFGKTKSISIDTSPDDLTMDMLVETVTTDFVKGLGFETAEETAAKMPVIEADYGLGNIVEGVTNKIFLKKDVITGIIQDSLNDEEVLENLWDSFEFGDGVNCESGIISIDEDFLDSYMDQRGYVPHDNDTLYHPSAGIVLTVTEGTE